MKATLIFPATKRHIEKYSEHEPFVINETPELYKDVTLPWIESSEFSIQWVHDLLEKKKDPDCIVMDDSDPEIGFVLVSDMWDRQKKESFFLVAIINKRGIRSLRDLTTEHLPLLKNILKKGKDAIEKDFGISSQKIKIYLHYQPSYHHLHIHFTHIGFDAPGSGGSDVMGAHLLTDVIDNITIVNDYYQRKTLSYPLDTVRDGDALQQKFKEHGYIF